MKQLLFYVFGRNIFGAEVFIGAACPKDELIDGVIRTAITGDLRSPEEIKAIRHLGHRAWDAVCDDAEARLEQLSAEQSKDPFKS